MKDKPRALPNTQPNGEYPLPLIDVLLRRRATVHFDPQQPVPKEYLDAILELAAQAPSGYNIQPWRFIVVQDQASREQLQRAAFNQAKVGEAPVVVIAVGLTESWKDEFKEILLEGARRGAGKESAVEKTAQGARQFLETMPMNVWVNRHVMIAVTVMMLAAEAYGFDTAPMEGFDAAAVKEEFGIPEEGEVVALLAIGKAAPPDKAYPGRFGLDKIVFQEHFGQTYQHAES